MVHRFRTYFALLTKLLVDVSKRYTNLIFNMKIVYRMRINKNVKNQFVFCTYKLFLIFHSFTTKIYTGYLRLNLISPNLFWYTEL